MAKLPRVTYKRFGANANVSDVGQFGAAAAGTKLDTKDIATIQSLPAWSNGWASATMSGNKYPTRQERNGVDYVHAYQIDYLLREGISEYDSQTEYNKGSIVKLVDNINITLYYSLIDNNIGQSLNNTAAWQEWGFVSKLGDTMTGNLNIFRSNGSPGLLLKRQDCAIGDVATGSQINVGSIWVNDRNNENVSVINTRIGTDGSTGIQIALQKHDLSGYNSIAFNTLPDGSATFDFPRCTTKPTTTSTASGSKVSVVVKNYLNGTSGYVKYSDGLIIQWGQNSTATQDAQISLLTSFTTTTYFVTLQLVNKRSGSQQNITPYDKSTSSFYRSCNGGTEYQNPIAWMAIGY